MSKKKINLGSRVLVETFGCSYRFEIVESSQADPKIGRISGQSPIGQALVGHKVKDKVRVRLINGETVPYKIVRVY